MLAIGEGLEPPLYIPDLDEIIGSVWHCHCAIR